MAQSTDLGVCQFQLNAGFDQRIHAHPGYYSFGLPCPGTTEVTVQLKSDRAIRLVLDYVNSTLSEDITAVELCTLSEDITAVELCTLADCSQRWLEQSFKARFGVSPKAYVKYLRLARLRRDLQQHHYGDRQTVMELASAYGFWHMSQLAADYRKVYG